MTLHVQPWEIFPGDKYVVASQFGPTYSGPLGRLQITNGIATHVLGVPRNFAFGHELHGTKNLGVFFKYIEGRKLQWIGDSWDYVNTVAHKIEGPTDKAVKKPVVIAEHPPVADLAKPIKQRSRRVRCSLCEKLFGKNDLVEGLCESCR